MPRLSAIVSPLLATSLLFLLASRWMGLGFESPATTLFGDTGDGFFNLWILEHLRLFLSGAGDTLSDGRILYPATDTFWFSDNLFALSPPYLLARAAGASRLAAAYYANLFWWAAAFAALWLLFSEVRKSVAARIPEVGNAADWVPPFLALALLYTPARLHGLQHFQNHAWTGWMLLLAFTLRHLRLRRTPDLVGMAACECALMASAPYYAILGLFPLAAWAFASALRLPHDARWILRQLPWAVPFVLGVALLAWQHARVGAPAYPVEELRRTALRFGHLLPPGWRTRELRVGGYPGLWILATVPCALAAACATPPRFRVSPPILLLVTTLVLVAGVALGPRYALGRGLAFLVPPLHGMRELVRFAPVVWVLAAALLFAISLPALCRFPRVGGGITAILLALALAETRPGATRRQIVPTEISLAPAPLRVFGAMEGGLLVVPSAPFHRNPVHMLRWQPCRGLRLLNGYSGRNTPAFEAVIHAENHHGRGSEEQVLAARDAGADWICLLRDWVPDPTERRIASEWPVFYQDAEFLVLDLRSLPGEGALPSPPETDSL